jgi:hypothetical protein
MLRRFASGQIGRDVNSRLDRSKDERWDQCLHEDALCVRAQSAVPMLETQLHRFMPVVVAHGVI